MDLRLFVLNLNPKTGVSYDFKHSFHIENKIFFKFSISSLLCVVSFQLKKLRIIWDFLGKSLRRIFAVAFCLRNYKMNAKQSFWVFFQTFGGTKSFSWGHYYPSFGLLITSAQGFKAKVDPALLYFLTTVQLISTQTKVITQVVSDLNVILSNVSFTCFVASSSNKLIYCEGLIHTD